VSCISFEITNSMKYKVDMLRQEKATKSKVQVQSLKIEEHSTGMNSNF